MLTDPCRYDYLPLIDRPIIRWPENAHVAFWVAPNIEFYEIKPPDGQGRPLWPRPYPDFLNYSLRDGSVWHNWLRDCSCIQETNSSYQETNLRHDLERCVT